MDSKEREELKRIASLTGEKIESSKVFLGFFTQAYQDDPMCALQIGIAVMLDKPIALLVPEDALGSLPGTLIHLAKAIEVFKRNDTQSIHDATRRLMDRMQEFL